MRSSSSLSRFLAQLSVCVVVVCALASSAGAEQRELAQARPAVDAVLLLDASGSMLKTDTQMLRYDGAKLFLQFLGKDDRLAIVSFADKAKVVSDLKEFSKEPREGVVQTIQSIKPEGQYSDLLEGIRAAGKILEASPRNDADRIIVLLSDGKMEPNPQSGAASARTLELVNIVLPDLKAKEIKVHSLAFSDQADKMLLSEISAVTDGLSFYTSTSDDVHKSFANLFLAVKRPQVLQMRSKSFTLDEDVDEATFYITRDEGSKLTLVSPKNEEMTAEKKPDWVTWFAGKNFDVITMREPDIGEWQVQGGVSTEGFATVLTDVRLVTDWPVVVRVGEKSVVQARLYDGSKPISLPQMSGVIQYAFQVVPTDRVAAPVAKDFLNDEGRDGDRVAGDGIFSRFCTISEPGEYKLSIVARGPTFERSQQVPFRVRPPLLTLEMIPGGGQASHEHHDAAGHHEATESSHGDAKGDFPKVVQGDQELVFRVDLSKEALGLRSLEVSVEALSADRRKTVIPLKRSSDDDGAFFQGTAEKLSQVGIYSITATLKGVSKKGQEIETETTPARFELMSVKKKRAATATPVQKDEAPESKPAEGLPLLPIALISGSSILAMIVGVILTKRSKSSTASSNQYNPPKQMLDAISSLEQKIASSDIKVGDVELETDREAEPNVSSAEASSPGQELQEEEKKEPTETPPTGEV